MSISKKHGKEVSTDVRHLLQHIYEAFNARQIEKVLALMQPDVDWPNGMEGGRVIGQAAVRDYWTRQWRMIDPSVEPTGFATDEAGRIVVDVHQVVRDKTGLLLVDQRVLHIYQLEDNLIRRMDIQSVH